MRALIREFSYERKYILLAIFMCTALYIAYLPMFKTAEVFLCYLTSYMFASIYGTILWNRKNTNFEIFLITTPLGRKKIVDTAYLLTIILNVIVIAVYYLLYLIKSKIFNVDYLSYTFLDLNINLIFSSFGVGLISNAIMFPTFLSADKDRKFIINLISILALAICLSVLTFVLKMFSSLGILWQNLIYTLVGLVIFIISYFITLKKYINKDF